MTYSLPFIKGLLFPPNCITALLATLLQFIVFFSLDLQFVLLSLLNISATLLRCRTRALRECTQQRAEEALAALAFFFATWSRGSSLCRLLCRCR